MGIYVAFPTSRSSPFSNNSLPSLQSPSLPISGSGSPEGIVPGVAGQTYIDVDTQDEYLKIAGTQAVGWRKIGSAFCCVTGAAGGGGGIKEIYSGEGPPNFTPEGDDAYYTDKLSGVGYSYYDGTWEHG